VARPEPKRDYTPEEVDAILERAVFEQAEKGTRLTHEELVSAASEVGIPRDAVDTAARDLLARQAGTGSALTDKQIVAAWKKRAWRGFARHLVPYVLVNAMLVFINLATSTAFYWFPIVMLAWGVGLVSHLLSVMWVDEERVVEREMRAREKRASRERWRTRGREFERAVEQGVKALLEVTEAPRARVEGQGPRVAPGSSADSELEEDDDEQPEKRSRRV
jgi:hypothetical protein